MLFGYLSKSYSSHSCFCGHHVQHPAEELHSHQCPSCSFPLIHMCTISFNNEGFPSNRCLAVFCCNTYRCSRHSDAIVVYRYQSDIISNNSNDSNTEPVNDFSTINDVAGWDDSIKLSVKPTKSKTPSTTLSVPTSCNCGHCLPFVPLEFSEGYSLSDLEEEEREQGGSSFIAQEYLEDDDEEFEAEMYETDDSDALAEGFSFLVQSNDFPVVQFTPVHVSRRVKQSAVVPKCQCGGNRVFAFQINSSIISLLKFDRFSRDDVMGGVDFGCIQVYECEKQCEGVKKEVVVVQYFD
ncbi:hypothetical protein RCL1_004729 [Eukaryota sp. TZLM3-RCL]